MKAIIMAGGEGSRLRPLTCDCPKPMVRLLNRPVMEYAIELLREHGITEIAVTLGYLPDAIMNHFGDGSAFGVHLTYFVEKTPLGTAGGVKQAQTFLDEPFVVLSGDGITDIDLTAAIAFHRQKNAMATLVLHRAEDVSEYGVVCTDADNRVQGFYEKPCRCDTLSDTINTGIYLLEPIALNRIPDGAFDFGHDLFPTLVRDNAPVFGYVAEGYWCDIGDSDAYLAANLDALHGKIGLPSLRRVAGRITVEDTASIAPSAVLTPPCYIAEGAKVYGSVTDSVIGESSVVGESAEVRGSVLWDNVKIGESARVGGCVMASRSGADSGAHCCDSTVLGADSLLGARAVLLPNAKLWPRVHTGAGESVSGSILRNRGAESVFENGIALTSAEQALRTARSMGWKEVILGRGEDADALWYAAASGCMEAGAHVIDAGRCTLPQLRHAQRTLRLPAALVDADCLTPLNEFGAYLTPRQRRGTALRSEVSEAAPITILKTDFPYIKSVAEMRKAPVECLPKVALAAPSKYLQTLAEQILLRAGFVIDASRADVQIELDATGESAALNGLDEAQTQLLRGWTATVMGETRLLLPVYATHAAEEICGDVEYFAGSTPAWMDALSKQSPRQFVLWFDGIAFAVCALSALAERGLTLSEWRKQMPIAHRQSAMVAVPASQTGHALRLFSERQSDVRLGGGLRFSRGDGWAWVCPDERRDAFRIVTESARAEVARELCDFCQNELRKWSGSAPN